jgi:hypothetical protein
MPSMARLHDHYLGGCFYRAKRNEGNTIPTAFRMVTGMRFAVFARRLPLGRFSFQVRKRGWRMLAPRQR